MICFSKYHGCGNDFIIVSEKEVVDSNYSELATKICNRNTGVGADGFIVVGENPLEMIFYNADGSRAPMCGNGIRCFAKYCFDKGIRNESEYKVLTLAGEMGVKVISENPFVVEIDMGKPDFTPIKCGIKTDKEDFLKQNIETKTGKHLVSSVFMGTIHTVLWIDDFEEDKLRSIGESISNHEIYSEKTNVNMAKVIDENTIRLMTYERGVGMTYACGTGACATVVIGSLEGKCKKDVKVLLPYGELFISIKNDNSVMMNGPAVKIAEGQFENM